jgi:flagellar secretion chaperone FliS
MALPSQEYLKTKVLTASPEMLTLMLWDGAIRFAEQGKDAILRKDIEASYKTLLRAQRIVMELNSSLKHEVDPDLCGKLSALYNFIYRRLVEANTSKDGKLVDDALEIMRHQRQTWVLLMDKLAKERAGEARETVNANVDAATQACQIPTSAQVGVTMPATRPQSPGRRAYPAMAVRPTLVPAGLSVQG